MDDDAFVRWGERIGAALGAGTVTLQRVGGQAWARGREAAARARTLERPAAPWVPDLDDLRRDVAELIAPRRRRRWLWVVAGLGAAAVGGAFLAWRRPVAPAPAAEAPRVEDVDLGELDAGEIEAEQPNGG